MITSPLMTRWCCLWQVRDIPLTFDVEKFQEPENIPGPDDAYVHYLAAAKLMRTARSKWTGRDADISAIREETLSILANPEVTWTPNLESWVHDHEPALTEFRQGGEKPSAKRVRPSHFNDPIAPLDDMRLLSRLAELAAVRSEKSGEFEEAWKWHRATLECARHAEAPRLAVCRQIGGGIRKMALSGIARWSQSPHVATSQLTEARENVKLEAAQLAPCSDFLKGEYLMVYHTLQQADVATWLQPNPSGTWVNHDSSLLIRRMGWWMLGEPEISMRIQRQLLANNLDYIDRPRHQRRKTLACQFAVIFDDDPASRYDWRKLSARQLASSIDHSRLDASNGSVWTVSRPQLAAAIDADRALMSAIDIVLAAQEFRRQHHEFPSTLDQLIPNYLTEIPLDPMSESAIPIRYRRDSVDEAVVWSVGRNGVDDGGNVEMTDGTSKDEGFRFHYDLSGIDSDNSAHPATFPSAEEPTE